MIASLDEDSAGVERRTSSLDKRLPLMISGLLAVTIAAFGMLAFSEVRHSTSTAATAQLRTVLGQAVENSSRNVTARLEALGRMANDSIVVRALATPASAPYMQQARELLRSRFRSSDSLTLRAQLLLDSSGAAHLLTGINPTLLERATLDSLVGATARSATAVISPFFVSGAQVLYWVIVPSAEKSGRVRGYLVEQRRLLGSPTLEPQIRALTGHDFSVHFTGVNGGHWISASGKLTLPRFSVRSLPDSFQVTFADGESIIGVKGRIQGTPWIAIFTATEAAVNRSSTMFLQRILVIAAILLAIGVIGARWVSRQVTVPLQSLTAAARAISRGEFERRLPVNAHDEIGDLSHAFNRMAARLGRSYQQLELRIRESDTLAAVLRQRNEELQLAQRLATDARVASDNARAEAQRASLAKSEFLAMMSHELRTPLSAIAGYAEILQLGIRGPLNDAQRSDLSRIQANQAHLLRIINDILDLTQIESGQIAMTPRPVRLQDVLAALEPIVAPLLEERALQLDIDPHLPDFVAMGEVERLTQVLVNLVANAIRFTEPGGSIRLSASAHQEHVRIAVTDSGIGIPADKQELVFLPFVQVDVGPSRRTQGTGLGLAISRRLVEAMGGTLTVASEVGIGSTFTIELASAHVSAGVAVTAGGSC